MCGIVDNLFQVRYQRTFYLMVLETVYLPNGHIFVDLSSIPSRYSTRKIRRYFIDFERRIHVEIMTSIRRGKFDADSSFKIDEIWMSSPRGFSLSFRRQIDVTSVLATISILSFSALATYSKANLV